MTGESREVQSRPIGRSPSRPRTSACRFLAGALALAAVVSATTVVAAGLPVAAATVTSSFRAAERPCRLADVRTGLGVERLDPTIVRIAVTGHCGIPADATAVALTVTVDAFTTREAGYVSIWPEGASVPTASIVNHWPGEVRANGTIVALSPTGTIAVLSLDPRPRGRRRHRLVRPRGHGHGGPVRTGEPHASDRHARRAALGAPGRGGDDHGPPARRRPHRCRCGRHHGHHHRNAGARLPVGRSRRHRPATVVGAQRRRRWPDPSGRSDRRRHPGRHRRVQPQRRARHRRRHGVVHRHVGARRPPTASSLPSPHHGGCSTRAPATRSGRVAAPRSRTSPRTPPHSR